MVQTSMIKIFRFINHFCISPFFWSFHIEEEKINFQFGFIKLVLKFEEVKNISQIGIPGFTLFTLKTELFRLYLFSFSSNLNSNILDDFRRVLEAEFNKKFEVTNHILAFVNDFLKRDIYLRDQLVKQFEDELAARFGSKYKQIPSKLKNSALFCKLSIQIKEEVSTLDIWISDFQATVDKRNFQFCCREKERALLYLDSMALTKPTGEQLDSIITFENNNLLVASAGSGKSATLVNKVCFAIERKYATSDEILILAFGSKAAMELKEKFEKIKSNNPTFKVPSAISTFHSFGAKICRSMTSNYKIESWSGKDDLFKLMRRFVTEIASNSNVGWRVAALMSFFTKQNIGSQKQLEHFTKLFGSGQDSWEIKKEAKKEDQSLRTLRGEYVRSVEELVIANWYFLHSVEYEYERETFYFDDGGEQRVHKPDFYLQELDIYHEHFGIDINGLAPEFLGDYDRDLGPFFGARVTSRLILSS